MPLEFDGRDAILLGDHNVSDYAGVCIEHGEEGAVMAAVLEWLMEDFCQTLTIWGVRQGSALGAALAAAAARFGWDVATEAEAVSPAVELPGGWDEYVAGLKKKYRHELRRKLRNLDDAGQVTVIEAYEPGEVEPAVEQLLSMMHQKAGKINPSS